MRGLHMFLKAQTWIAKGIHVQDLISEPSPPLHILEASCSETDMQEPTSQ